MRAVITGDIQAYPSGIHFGIGPVGHTVEDTLMLHSISGTDFEVESIDFGAADIGVVPVLTAPQKSKAFKITHQIKVTGDRSMKIVFHVRTATNHRESEVPVTLICRGVP